MDSVLAVDKFGNGPLHIAAMSNDIEIATLLLKIPGIDPHLKNNSGLMAYQLAVVFNHIDIAPYIAPSSVHLEFGRS